MKILEEKTETRNVPYLQENLWNTRESGLGLAEIWSRGKGDKEAKREIAKSKLSKQTRRLMF